MGEIDEPRSPKPEITAPAPISLQHDCAGFGCGHDALDDWLRLQALKSEGKTARTYVVADGQRIVAYYCLASGAERRANMPKKIRQGLPDPTPVTIIGRLAVGRAYQGRGIGLGMLKDALLRAASAAEIIGTRAVLVHAIDDQAVAFYASLGFLEFPGGSRTLFLPIETISASAA